MRLSKWRGGGGGGWQQWKKDKLAFITRTNWSREDKDNEPKRYEKSLSERNEAKGTWEEEQLIEQEKNVKKTVK